jgi:catechol 2,3-dioxygenase-like lactoylglutathione lyase family enzyme
MEIKDFCIGIQHIGIPTNDIKKTKEFFANIGFNVAYETVNGTEEVAFLQLDNCIIETWQCKTATMAYGAIDHISLDVKNIDILFELVKVKGLKLLDDHVCTLPFWERGVKFFTIEGPDKEKVEFCEKL